MGNQQSLALFQAFNLFSEKNCFSSKANLATKQIFDFFLC